ncbi:MAG: protein-methionine-sulfoxide reductase catalytic subunit MsrP [Pseudomonadota bacterium]
MLIRRQRGWEMPEREATPESVYWNRRQILGAGIIGAGVGAIAAAGVSRSAQAQPRYPAPRNADFATLDRELSPKALVTSYNNFVEYGSHKRIAAAAQQLRISSWAVTFDGMVETPRTVDFEDIMRVMSLEERLYRFRCVETWSMAVPWTGFPLRALVDYARPLASAKYLMMETFHDASMAPGQRQFWYPWPYTEGLTMAEATNELSFIATGIYGQPIPKQNGAPLRLVVPWKYGFKSVKSIVRFHFTDQRPTTYWSEVGPNEYGFWANVNPAVDHPRWSQATENMLGENERIPTLIYNGYGDYVADLYKGLEGERLYM